MSIRVHGCVESPGPSLKSDDKELARAGAGPGYALKQIGETGRAAALGIVLQRQSHRSAIQPQRLNLERRCHHTERRELSGRGCSSSPRVRRKVGHAF